MKKILLFLGTILLFIVPFSVSAEEVYSELPVEVINIYKELDKVSEIDETGLVVVNIEAARKQGISDQAMNIAYIINDLGNTIRDEGNEVFFRKVFYGVYGNFCGSGNNGWLTQPIDDLDAACRLHDTCFTGSYSKNDPCNQEFLRKLLPIIQVTPPLSHKGIVAIGAYRLFSQ